MSTAPSERPKVFVSYDRTNAPLARLLQCDLARAGLEAWLDTRDIAPHDPDWETTITENICSCDHFILLASIEAAASVPVSDEFKIALESEKKIYILRTCGLENLPAAWRVRQVVDFTFAEIGYHAALSKLVTSLMGKPSQKISSLFELLDHGTLSVGEAADALSEDASFTVDGITFRYLPMMPSAYSTTYLVAPEQNRLVLPDQLAFLCKCTGELSRGDTVAEVMRHRLQEDHPAWVFFMKGHVPKGSNRFMIPLNDPHIWADLAISATRVLQAPIIKGKPIDLYLECPAVLAFDIGGRLRGMTPFRCFQFDYKSTYFEVMRSDSVQ
jgi:hypothetical protein